MNKDLVRRRLRLGISCHAIQEATGIPASEVDYTLRDPKRLGRLSLDSARALARLVKFDLSMAHAKTPPSGPSTSKVDEEVIRQLSFLLAQQRCDRLVLQRLFQWSDSEPSDAIHQVSERAARLG